MGLLNLVVSGANMEDIFRGLDDFEASLDLRPLAEDMAIFIESDNREARLSGVDVDGQSMVPVTASTRKTRDGNPDADPFVPHGTASRSIRDFTTEVTPFGDDAIAITGAWPSTPFIHFHVTGYTSRAGNPVPIRNIVGIRPSARDRLEQMLHDWTASKIKGS